MIATTRSKTSLSLTGLLMMLCLFVTASAISCQRPRQIQEKSLPPAPGYLRRANSPTVTVFASLFEDTSAWTNPQSGISWPIMLKQDPDFRDADIYIYSLGAASFSGGTTIEELAARMNKALDRDEVFSSHQQVTLICHGLGLLVTEALLLQRPQLALRTQFIYAIEPLLSRSDIGFLRDRQREFSDVFPDNAADYTVSLHRQWRLLPHPPKVYCVSASKRSTLTPSVCDDLTILPTTQPPSSPFDAIHVKFRLAYKHRQFTNDVVPKVVERLARSEPIQVNVGCAEEQVQILRVSSSIPAAPSRTVTPTKVDVVNGENVKSASAELIDKEGDRAVIRVRLTGLDRDFTGNCPAGGHATVQVTWLVSEVQTNAP